MYKILITAALAQELKTIKSNITKEKNHIKIDYLSTWVWNYNTILFLTKHLKENNYDFVINIWICWYIKDNKPFQVARIINLNNNKELISPIGFKFLKLDSIACSESIIYNEVDLNWEKYVDMESFWFEMVCDNFKVPRIILKVPYDKIWSKETIDFKKDKALEKLEQINFEKLLKEILNFLKKYKKEEIDLSKYEIYYKLSFAEKLIFEKLYYRYTSLTWKDFEKYFEKNKDFTKKEFMNKLSEIN